MIPKNYDRRPDITKTLTKNTNKRQKTQKYHFGTVFEGEAVNFFSQFFSLQHRVSELSGYENIKINSVTFKKITSDWCGRPIGGGGVS